MAEPTNYPDTGAGAMPTTDRDTLDYRPVSGWAIVSFVVASIYIIVVGVGGVLALYTWTPYLLPLWTLLLPTVGLGLATYSLFTIRHAEGTLAGAKLASISWWICVLLAVIYASFYGATRMAVTAQADSLVREWFELVRAGKINEAYLRTVHPEQRLGVSPEDEKLLRARWNVVTPMARRGALSTFRSSQIVQLIQQGGAESRLEAQGVKEWEYNEGGYQVTRRYQIVTPEGKIELTITTESAESKTKVYPGRQWRLTWDKNALANAELTDYGKKLGVLRLQGHDFLRAWKMKILSRTPENLESAYLDTQPIAEREAKRAAFRSGRMDLKGILGPESARLGDEAWRKAAAALFKEFFRPPSDDPVQLANLDFFLEGSRRWEQREGRIRFTFDGETLFGPAGKPAFKGELTVEMESDAGAVESGRSANWRIVLVEMFQATQPPPQDAKMR